MRNWLLLDESPANRQHIYDHLGVDFWKLNSAQDLVNTLDHLDKNHSIDNYGLLIASYFTFNQDKDKIYFPIDDELFGSNEFNLSHKNSDIFDFYKKLIIGDTYRSKGLIKPLPTIFLLHEEQRSDYQAIEPTLKIGLASALPNEPVKLTSFNQDAPVSGLNSLLNNW